jgi:lipopolysaccharide/colanic/teichoic acid biosynthesis glycosyltransferase
VPEETLRLEYDLYYVKQESPSLDLDIFLRTIFRVQLASARAIGIARSAVQ